MAEFLSPGIYIEEVNTGGQQVESVSTSTMGIVGWTERGPVDVATIVTNVDDFQRKFGEYTNDSRVPLTVQAFFANGGSRAYVVRVVPSDAVKGAGLISDVIVNESIGVGTGATLSLGPITLANAPILPGSVTITWQDVALGPDITVTDDGLGVFALTTNVTVVAGTINYTTGVMSISFTGGTDLPYLAGAITASYTQRQWALTAANEGDWAGRMTLRISGNSNYFTYGQQAVSGAGEYSKYDIAVLVENTLTGVDEIKETYEEVVFSDPDDALYFADVLNDNSDFVAVTDLGVLDVPSTFKGIDRTAVTIATGNASLTAFTGTIANAPIVKSSLVLTYTPVATGLRTLAVDVNGIVTGTGIDTTKTNVVNLTTGVFTLNFLTDTDAPAASPISATYISMPTTSTVDYVFTGGADGTLTGGTFDRTRFTSPVLSADKRGMYALARLDEVMQLAIPDFAGDTTVAGDMLDYAELRKDVFVILNTPKGMSDQQAADYKTVTFTRKSKYAAMYWPWVKVTDPLNPLKTITLPNMGHVAGVYARTDQTRNVGKAPGGTIDGALRFLSGLETNPDKGSRDLLYPLRINPLINTAQTGLAVWGVRTMSSTNDVLRYVNAVRLFQFVEKSVFNSTFGFVFESISSTLYGNIKATVDSFLFNLYNTGHFAGNSPSQAYFVICDGSNNPPEVANAGQVVVDIGIAPNKPGEFIRFRFSQKTINS